MEIKAEDSSRIKAQKTRELIEKKGIKSPELGKLFPVRFDEKTIKYYRSKEIADKIRAEIEQNQKPKHNLFAAFHDDKFCRDCKNCVKRPKNLKTFGCALQHKGGDDIVRIYSDNNACELLDEK